MIMSVMFYSLEEAAEKLSKSKDEVKKSDEESERIPNAVTWNGTNYFRSNMTGRISLKNNLSDTIELEVKRNVLGTMDSASNDGVIIQKGSYEGDWMDPDSFPFWWSWYNWPYWWYHFNAVSRVSWECEIEPGKSIELEYQWHYFWRR